MYFIWDSKNSKNPNSGKLSGWKPNDCVDFHFSISPYNRCHYITNLNQAFKFKSLTISHKFPLFNQPLDMRNKNIQLSLKHPLDIRTNLINPLIPYKSFMSSPLTQLNQKDELGHPQSFPTSAPSRNVQSQPWYLYLENGKKTSTLHQRDKPGTTSLHQKPFGVVRDYLPKVENLLPLMQTWHLQVFMDDGSRIMKPLRLTGGLEYPTASDGEIRRQGTLCQPDNHRIDRESSSTWECVFGKGFCGFRFFDDTKRFREESIIYCRTSRVSFSLLCRCLSFLQSPNSCKSGSTKS